MSYSTLEINHPFAALSRPASLVGFALLLVLAGRPIWADDDSRESRATARGAGSEHRSEASPMAGRATATPVSSSSSSSSDGETVASTDTGSGSRGGHNNSGHHGSGNHGGNSGHHGDSGHHGGYSGGHYDGGNHGGNHGGSHHGGSWGGYQPSRGNDHGGYRGERHHGNRGGSYGRYGYGYPYGYGYGYPYGYGYHGYCRWCWWYPWGATVYVEGDEHEGYSRNSGAFDLDLNPERAQVFIDGRYIGVADDYDGFPAFLWLEAGTYDVVFYLPGYRTISRQYTLRPGVVIDIEDDMQPGEAVRPEDLVTKSTVRRDERIRRNDELDAEVTARERAAEDRARQGGNARPEREQEVGRLYLSLWPDDAAIYLDGHFLGTAGELGQLSAGLVVEPGEHRLEVVHPGFRTVQRTVNVPSGEKVDIKFDLDEN